MKYLLNILLIITTLFTLQSCKSNKNSVTYKIYITDRVSCAMDSTTIEVEYSLECEDAVRVNASTDAEWITSIDTSSRGIVAITVAQNDGETRNAYITLSANGYHTATFRLTQYGAPPAVATHTLMYFFCGTSLSRYFRTNLEDATLAIKNGILGNSNRVIFFRQISSSVAYIGELCYDVASGECYERKIEENIVVGGKQLSADDMGEYIRKMSEYAPAHRYGIVLAGHGRGWIPRDGSSGANSYSTFSPESYNPWIPAVGAEVTRYFGESNMTANISEIAEGIEKSGVMLDYILFDACFMANIESIYELRNSANYIIASPCEIMGRGFPYERTLPYIFEDEGHTTNYSKVAESYYLYYRDEYVGSARCGSIALFDCSQLENLAQATANVIKSAKSDYDKSTLQSYEGQNPHYFYDFGEWVNVVATDNEALNHFNEVLAKCVISKYTLPEFYSAFGNYGTYSINEDVYSGVTTSAPSDAYPTQWRATNWYKEVFE